MRTPLTSLCLATLLWGFAQAPFDHIHPEDSHPVSAPAHWHFEHAATGTAIDAYASDEDEIDVYWGGPVPTQLALMDSVDRSLAREIPAPIEVHFDAPAPEQRSHDPPLPPTPPPRAPPA